MKILYFAPHQAWPLITGNRLRDYHQARELAQRCSVTFLELLHPQDERGVAPPASAGFRRVVTAEKERNYTPAKVLRGLLGPVPVTVLNYYSQAVADVLADVLREGDFDIVQLESVQLSGYIPVIQAAASKPLILADWHNIESELMQRFATGTRNLPKKLVAHRTASLLHRAEDRLLRTCAAHTTASERERQQLLARAPGARVHAIPNGVDTSHYANLDRTAGIDGNGRALLFVGSMDYHANADGAVWFAREVWPRIAATYPDLHFYIVGRDPGPQVRALATDRIHVTGTVDDVRPYYAGAAAVVVPLHVGSGTRLKILEAMAAGVPIVSTRLGAEGIDCQSGEHLLLADKEEEMAKAVRRILEPGSEVGRRLAEAGQDLVRTQYDWSVVGARLYAIHQELAAERSSIGRDRKAGVH